jgi:hypothetical protein
MKKFITQKVQYLLIAYYERKTMNTRKLSHLNELCPDIEPTDENYLALRRGYALEKYFPEILLKVDSCIKQSTEDCQMSWHIESKPITK